MSKKRTKPQLVTKVEGETHVPAADLERLPVESLELLDAIVPDKEVEVIEEKLKTFVGFHPITGEKVYL